MATRADTAQPACSMIATTPRPKLQEFKPETYDYLILRDLPLGLGRWSDVFMGRPIQCAPHPLTRSQSQDYGLLTPPTSPTKGITPINWRSYPPEYYAVKLPTNRSAIGALLHEAKILTHLSHIPGQHDCIVPFYGFDKRNNSIILTALRENLDSVITEHLSGLEESERTDVVCRLFPRLARSLALNLAWLHTAGVVHGDLKPSNILLRPDIVLAKEKSIVDVPFTPLLADFTSSSHRRDVSDPDTSASVNPVGGGTYSYLAPEMLKVPAPASSKSADVYALGIILLHFITGECPFVAAEGNRHHLLAMIKAGSPIEFAMLDPKSATRLWAITAQLKQINGIDVMHLLKLGLTKSNADRISAQEWSEMF
jgi:serine/threonine protein kinase